MYVILYFDVLNSTFFLFLSCLNCKKFRYEYFMDVNALAQIINTPLKSLLPLPKSLLPLPNCPRQGLVIPDASVLQLSRFVRVTCV